MGANQRWVVQGWELGLALNWRWGVGRGRRARPSVQRVRFARGRTGDRAPLGTWADETSSAGPNKCELCSSALRQRWGLQLGFGMSQTTSTGATSKHAAVLIGIGSASERRTTHLRGSTTTKYFLFLSSLSLSGCFVAEGRHHGAGNHTHVVERTTAWTKSGEGEGGFGMSPMGVGVWDAQAHAERVGHEGWMRVSNLGTVCVGHVCWLPVWRRGWDVQTRKW